MSCLQCINGYCMCRRDARDSDVMHVVRFRMEINKHTRLAVFL